MKKLSKLGIGYIENKKIMRNYDLEQVDKMIEEINIIRNTAEFKNFEKQFKIFKNFIREIWMNVKSEYQNDKIH